MKHCVFTASNCEENRIEIEAAKEIAEYLKFDLHEEYKDGEIEVLESDKTEIYLISDNLCTLINMCMDYAREEACRRMSDMGNPYLD